MTRALTVPPVEVFAPPPVPDEPPIRAAVTELPPYVPGRRAASADTAALASNESHFPPLPSVVQAIAAAAQGVNRYPDPTAELLRRRIAEHVEVHPDEVAVGPGSVGVLQQLVTAVCDAGDEVVFAWRSFEAYPVLCRLAGAVPVAVPLTAAERHDLDAMAAAITPRTRLVLLCTPNNPTGTTIGAEELDRFLAAVPADVLVVIDEAYLEYTGTESPDATVRRFRRHRNVCLLRTFSKAYGLAGLRVGYALAHRRMAAALRRTALPFAVNALAQAAAGASLDAADELRVRVAAVIDERERMTARLRAHGWVLPDSSANFLWLRIPDAGRERLVRVLDEAGILVRGYPADGVRITVADRAANDRVLAVLADHDRAAA